MWAGLSVIGEDVLFGGGDQRLFTFAGLYTKKAALASIGYKAAFLSTSGLCDNVNGNWLGGICLRRSSQLCYRPTLLRSRFLFPGTEGCLLLDLSW